MWQTRFLDGAPRFLTLQDEDMFAAIDRFGLVGTDISDLAQALDPGTRRSG